MRGTVCPGHTQGGTVARALLLYPPPACLPALLPWPRPYKGEGQRHAVQSSWAWQGGKGGGDGLSSPRVTLWGKEGGSQREER